MVMEILNKINYKGNAGVYFALCFFLGLILLSCEKEANVDIPKTEPKPVLVCFLSPEDSFITVRLTNSIPLYTGVSNQYPLEIKNAELRLSDGSSSIIIPWYKDSVGYRVSTSLFPIISGKTYTLEVSIPDGRRLKATTTVPNKNFPEVVISVAREMTDSSEFGVFYDLTYELSWLDPSGEDDFYRTLLTNLVVDTFVSADTSSQLMLELIESDKDKDNSTFKVFGNSKLFYEPGTNNPLGDNVNLAYLILSNEEYYLYHKDLYESNDRNPFSEAKINFSNIEGGIGCFAAYRMKRKRF
jgi:hypothetical protein